MSYSDKELGTLLVDMARINNKLSNGDFLKSLSGDALSYVGVKLAAMKASLLDLKVDAHKQMLDDETDMETMKGQARKRAAKEDGATASGDTKNADEEYIAAKKKANASKVQYERLNSALRDAHDLIDAIKSRVIDLQGQRKNESIR